MSTLKVNNIQNANGTDAISIGSDGSLSYPNIGRRNLIINGAMQVAQRGTSFTGSEYTLDRWYQNLSGGTATLTQETFTAGSEIAQSKNYLKQAVSVGNNYCGLRYRHEGTRTIPSGETVTLSFYAKGTNPAGGYLNVNVQQDFGTGGTPSTDVEVYNNDTAVVLTSSWQRFTFTFTYTSYSGKTFGTNNDDFCSISIRQPAGDTSTAAWELDITGVQLEVGSVATPFEHRSYGEELALCERYFEKSYNYDVALGAVATQGSVGHGGLYQHTTTGEINGGTIQFKVKKRAAPTMGWWDQAGNPNKCTRLNAGIAWHHNQNLSAPFGGSEYGYSINSPSGDGATGMFVHFAADAEL